mmetsp:Transcript_22568/g.34204  ORF Transcript_22568/g.34204 Transcript_22568/m.34204 type:complete len:82 (-) Transcript_22568:444-689(-)
MLRTATADNKDTEKHNNIHYYNVRINRQNNLSNLPRQHRRLMDTNNTTTHNPPLPVPPSKFHHISTIYRQSKDLLEETIGL